MPGMSQVCGGITVLLRAWWTPPASQGAGEAQGSQAPPGHMREQVLGGDSLGLCPIPQAPQENTAAARAMQTVLSLGGPRKHYTEHPP